MTLNIIYMHSHDTGRYVSPYGYNVRTPALHRFAQQGVLFRQAFCANPTCSPSRGALLTGQYAHSAGILGLAHRGFPLPHFDHHLVNTLKPAGYHTVLAGVQHVARHSEVDQIGYDERLEIPGEGVARAEVAAEYLRKQAKQRQPFFMDVGFVEMHRDFPDHDAEDDPRYMQPPAPFGDTPETRKDMADYATMVNRLDKAMGIVLDTLDRTQLNQNTLVIVTTDHGIAFPAMKCNLTDHGIGVMLMMRGPFATGFTSGKCIDALVSHIDVFPTLCALAGIGKPGWLQGESLVPLVNGEVKHVRDEVFAEVNWHASYEPKRCVRTQRYKFIRRYDGRNTPVLPNCDASITKDFWLEHGWKDRPIPSEALYDLYFDPHEANNLLGRTDGPDVSDVYEDLTGRLDRWMRETDDPILKGPLTPPPGSKTNPPDQLSPNDPVTVHREG